MIRGNMQNNLKSFSIFGLFGTRDINIPFNSGINILIGENGLGKTTMLNILYYTLTCKFSKLNTIVFDRLILKFYSGRIVEINKDDIMFYSEENRYGRFDRVYDYVNDLITDNEKQEVYELLQQDEKEARDKMIDITNRLSRRGPFSPNVIRRAVFSTFDGRFGRIEEIKTIIKKELGCEVLYFPTYRRIEEELHNLGTGKIELDRDDKRLIQFGMEDVNETFEKVILNIKNSAIEGFSAITGEMLSQYVDGLHDIDEEIKNRIQPDILNIILERVGENIAPTYKARIIELVNSKEIFVKEEQYKYLINFLSNLIKSYDQQKTLDNLIKGFAGVCNSYLNGKKVNYNESKVEISIVQNNGHEIELKNLSSGEKQIISLFAKIFLESNENIILLFDEPELSLSIEWQRKLLPDILKSQKCGLLLAVTHSPFIFENELDLMAKDMNIYVREYGYGTDR